MKLLDSNTIYQKLSLIQSINLVLVAISLFDLGYSREIYRGIWFNYILFDYAKINFPLWGLYQFWALNFLIFGICHFLKTQPYQDWDYHRIANISGMIAISTFVGFHLLALGFALPEFDFKHQAFSQLVLFGDIPSALSVYSFLIPSVFSLPFLIQRSFMLIPIWINKLNLAISVFGSLMMFFLALTTVTNEPVDHAIFVNPMFFSYVVIILIFSKFSAVEGKIAKDLRMLGYTTLLVFIVFTIVGLFAPPILEQIFFTTFISAWFLYFGIKTNEHYKILTNIPEPA